MTLLTDTTVAGKAGTHVLAIGVGSYPHLLRGTGKLADKPLGLKQLESPPVSMRALLNWFLAPEAGCVGFRNPGAPLASVEALVSSRDAFAFNTSNAMVQVKPATRQNIQDAFEAWLARMKSHPDNIGVFYFCGHGLMVSDHYLLAEDFGQSKSQPWAQAFDISNTIRAVSREVSGAVFYFIDACRQIARDVAMTLGANPMALMAADLAKKVTRKYSTTIYATGEGELAFAPPGGQVSRFTAALLAAMSGYSGLKKPGSTTWNVDGEGIAAAIRQLLQFESLRAAGRDSAPQVSEQSVYGASVPLQVLTCAPKVKVWLDLAPPEQRASYEIYLQPAAGNPVVQSLLNQVFQVEVARGFYDVGARDPAGTLPPLLYTEEELTPPLYSLTLQARA